LWLDAGSFQESRNTVLPLLNVRNNASTDVAETRETFTIPTSADEPVVIPDDLLLPPSLSEKNDAIVQFAQNESRDSLPIFTAGDFTTETTATDQSMFSTNETTTAIESVEITATRKPLVNPLESKGNYSATSNNTKLVH